jgi:limonene-1,2-epoxide hydrolase
VSLPAALTDLLAAVEKRDADALGDCFTADATYATAVPLPPLVGREAIVALFSGLFSQVGSARFEVLGYSVDGDRVWTERIDHFTFGERPVSIEVMGVFELAGGKIVAVRDYVDMNTWRERKNS